MPVLRNIRANLLTARLRSQLQLSSNAIVDLEVKVVADENRLEAIRRKMADYSGLTPKEIEIATKAGLIRRDQAYFWTPEWQRDIKEAEEDFKEGRYKEFDNIEDLLRELKREDKA